VESRLKPGRERIACPANHLITNPPRQAQPSKNQLRGIDVMTTNRHALVINAKPSDFRPATAEEWASAQRATGQAAGQDPHDPYNWSAVVERVVDPARTKAQGSASIRGRVPSLRELDERS
jgi:hypothetical protein